ncbi:MAG: hypothetical protein ACOY3Y_21355 [Acidobacteriota bacterium]
MREREEIRGHVYAITAGRFWAGLLVTLCTLGGMAYGALRVVVPPIAQEAVQQDIAALQRMDDLLRSDMQRENAAQDARLQQTYQQILDELRDIRRQLGEYLRDQANRRK